MKRGAAYQAPAAFTPTVMARKGAKEFSLFASSIDPLAVTALHEKDMFLVMEERVLITIFSLWQSCEDDAIIAK
jgi:hypothetical protein